MEVLGDYRKHLSALGISEETGKVGAVAMTHQVFQIAIFANLILYIVSKWKYIDDRFVALKALPVSMLTFGYTVSLVVFFDDFNLMVAATLKRVHFAIPYKISSRRVEIMQSLQSFMNTINYLWRILLQSYIWIAIFFPLISVLVNIYLFSETFQNALKETYAVPFPLYYPGYFSRFPDTEYLLNTIWYIVGFTVEFLYFVICFYICHLSYSIPISSILNVQVEFKLLKLSLMEMDDFLDNSLRSNYSTSVDKSRTDRLLREFMNYFVRHHQNTYRKFDAVNKGIRWIAFTVCTTATLYICLSLYTIVQTDQILKKLHEAVFLTTWLNSLFQFCFFGERLKTEVENFRNALYESAWLDKPQWFKRSLLIMMARTSRPMDIKPFGFYGFDFNRFATAMNAVYCYYNMLCNFKSNDQ